MNVRERIEHIAALAWNQGDRYDDAPDEREAVHEEEERCTAQLVADVTALVEAARPFREHGIVEFSDGEAFCLWCGAIKRAREAAHRHKDSCVRQALIAALAPFEEDANA